MTIHGRLHDSDAFHALLAGYPAAARPLLANIHGRPDFCARLRAAEAAELAAVLGKSIPELMVALLPFAALYAIPPISNFKVGVISQSATSGSLYYGANIEFVGQALSFCVHAEQSSVTSAWISGEQGISRLAVTAAPCGYCRQFLNELAGAANLTIEIANRPPQPIATYLPEAFGPTDLGITGGLLQPTNNALVLTDPTADDPVVLAALSAANMSYAPYSHGYAGVALQTADGTIHTGPYAENAAFNPSMSPMAVTLSRLNLAGHPFTTITRAVLVQADSKCLQITASRAVLAAVSEVELEVRMAGALLSPPGQA
jgi:cytidine deaminase